MLHSHHLKGAFYSIKHRRKLFAKLQNTDMNNENHNEHSSHPTDNTYIKIAVILGVITALEVAIFYVGWIPDLVFFTILICMSVVKFAIVAMYYMHLKFDESIFLWLFGGGILLASCVIIALMVLFDQL